MTYSSGSYSSSAYSAAPGQGAAPDDSIHAGLALTVVLAFSCDAEIRSRSDFGDQLTVKLSFECDAQLVGGTGGDSNPTRPTGWTADTAVTTIWVPDRPITGS